MALFKPIECSTEWYQFVANIALKDDQVIALARSYVDAMNKLNERVAELAKGDASLKVTQQLPSASSVANGISSDFTDYAVKFHAQHGVTVTPAEIADDARRNHIKAASLVV